MKIAKILFYNFILVSFYEILGFLNLYLKIPLKWNSMPLSPLYFIFVLSLLVFFDRMHEKNPWEHYGIKKIKEEEIGVIFLFFALLFPAALFSRIITPSFDLWYAKFFQTNLITLFFLIPLGVLIEEIGERSLLQAKLSSIYDAKTAFYVTAVNYTFLHINWLFGGSIKFGIVILTSAFLYALVTSLLFLYTKNIFLTILLHLSLNLALFLQIFLRINESLRDYEFLFWMTWLILFILYVPKALTHAKKVLKVKGVKLKARDKVILTIIALFTAVIFVILRYFSLLLTKLV